MLAWCCSGRRNKVKNPDERSRLLDGDGVDDARNLHSATTSPPTSSYHSPSINNTPATNSPNPEQSFAYSYPNQEDAASLNNIVSRASEKMVNITNSTSSLKAATSMHSLRDLNSLSTWLESDPIKPDKATEFEQELIKQTANDLTKIFQNAFDVSLSQSNSEASSRRSSVSIGGLSIQQRSMHEEFENTPRQTVSSTPKNN